MGERRGVRRRLVVAIAVVWVVAAACPPAPSRGEARSELARIRDRLERDRLETPTEIAEAAAVLRRVDGPDDRLVARELGIVAAMLEEHPDPPPVDPEVARLATRADAGEDDAAARKRVLALWRAGRLEAPGDLANAARVLTLDGRVEVRRIANDLAEAAARRGAAGAGALFARTWDRYAAAAGAAPRYGTEEGGRRPAPSVAPVVLRSFGIVWPPADGGHGG